MLISPAVSFFNFVLPWWYLFRADTYARPRISKREYAGQVIPRGSLALPFSTLSRSSNNKSRAYERILCECAQRILSPTLVALALGYALFMSARRSCSFSKPQPRDTVRAESPRFRSKLTWIYQETFEFLNEPILRNVINVSGFFFRILKLLFSLQATNNFKNKRFKQFEND